MAVAVDPQDELPRPFERRDDLLELGRVVEAGLAPRPVALRPFELRAVERVAGGDDDQLGLFSAAGPSAAERDALAALRALDVERTTPLEALELLARLRSELSEGEA